MCNNRGTWRCVTTSVPFSLWSCHDDFFAVDGEFHFSCEFHHVQQRVNGIVTPQLARERVCFQRFIMPIKLHILLPRKKGKHIFEGVVFEYQHPVLPAAIQACVHFPLLDVPLGTGKQSLLSRLQQHPLAI